MQNRFGKIITASALALGVFSTTTLAEGATMSEDPVSRIQGDNRFETAALISSGTYETADTVIIANAREFADALAGVPLAYQKNAPILLAQGNALRADTTSEIIRLGASKAIILGGEAAVSQGIENELSALGLTVERLAGDNRFKTAEIIAAELTATQPSNAAVVVDGFEFADAMSVAPFAAREGMPIYLTRSNRLVSEEAMKEYSNTYIVGGTTAVSQAVEESLNNPTRLHGANRYSTNIAVMDYFGINSDHLFISTGQDFVDALTGSVLAAHSSTGIALVRNDISNDLNSFIDANNFAEFTLLGGAAAVPEQVNLSLESYLTEKEFVKTIFIIENEEPFLTEEVENDQVPEGESTILQEGMAGYDEVTYEVTIKNGHEVSRKELNRVTHEPVEEIVEIGTQTTETEKIVEKENFVDYETVYEEDDTLPVGETELYRQGEKGYEQVTTEVTYINGVESSREEVKREVVEPIDEVIKTGTKILVESVEISNPIETILLGDTHHFTATVLPEDATVKEVVWETNDSEVATVTEDGKLTTHSVGAVTITATEKDGDSMDSVVFEVKPVLMESLEITNTESTMYVFGELQIEAAILPVNTTNQELTYTSDNTEVASIDENGKVTAHKEGLVEIKVSNDDGSIYDTIEIEVVLPELKEVEQLKYTITQFDSFALPETVSVLLSNDTEQEVTVSWEKVEVETNTSGDYTFVGTIETFDYEVELELTIEEYRLNVSTRAYSSFTINNVSQAMSISISNLEDSTIDIDKIELYSRENLYTSYSAQRLEDGDIDSYVLPRKNWGISVNFSFGMPLTDSFVRYYFVFNGEEFVIEERLDN